MGYAMKNMNKSQLNEFIHLLQKYELSVATLYETFAAIQPSSKDVWKKFAEDERLHAKWIQTLHAYLQDEKISFAQTRITSQSIKTSIAYIDDQIKKAIDSKIDLKQALIIAIDIEKSVLESGFLKVFKFSGPEAKKIQSRLLEATLTHRRQLIEWQTKIQ